jgi:hypothetical protein
MVSDFNNQSKFKTQFNKSKLPSPSDYYKTHGLEINTALVWQKTKCVFHSDGRPSLSINTKTGGYQCWSCGAKGGDILDFHRQLNGMTFMSACKALGCWEES